MEYKIVEGAYKPQKKGITLSHSSMSVMEQCGRQYFLQYIKKIRVDDSKIWSTFGSLVHLISENYKGGGKEELQGLLSYVLENEKLKTKYYDPLDEKYKAKFKKAMFLLHKWYSRREKIFGEDYDREYQIDIHNVDEVDGTPIHLTGKIDGLYKKDNKYFITDFKTGKARKNHSKQLGYYYLLLTLENPDILEGDFDMVGEIPNVCLDVDDEKDFVEYYELEEYDMVYNQNRVLKSIDKLRKLGINPETDHDNWEKKTSALCPYCKYYSSGHCKGKDGEE